MVQLLVSSLIIYAGGFDLNSSLFFAQFLEDPHFNWMLDIVFYINRVHFRE